MAFQWVCFCSSIVANWGNFEVLNKIGGKTNINLTNTSWKTKVGSDSCSFYILSRSCSSCMDDSVSSAIWNLCSYSGLYKCTPLDPVFLKSEKGWEGNESFLSVWPAAVFCCNFKQVECQKELDLFCHTAVCHFWLCHNADQKKRIKDFILIEALGPESAEHSKRWFLHLFWEAIWGLIIIAALISQPLTWASLSNTGNKFDTFRVVETKERSTNFTDCCSRSHRPLWFLISFDKT